MEVAPKRHIWEPAPFGGGRTGHGCGRQPPQLLAIKAALDARQGLWGLPTAPILGGAEGDFKQGSAKKTFVSWQVLGNIYGGSAKKTYLGARPHRGRAHGTWVRAGAPADRGGKSGFSRPHRSAGASDRAHFGWGRGGKTPKKHLCPRLAGAKGVDVRYA